MISRLRAAGAIKALPEWIAVEQDRSVAADNPRASLVAWLLTTQTFRTDNGTPITNTYAQKTSGRPARTGELDRLLCVAGCRLILSELR